MSTESTPIKKRKLTSDNTDTTNTVLPTPDTLDLGYLLAPISRRDLELFVCDLIVDQPQKVSKLIELSRKQYNIHELKNEVLNIFAYNYDTQSEITDQLAPYIELITSYSTANDCVNVYDILLTLCTEITKWYTSEHKRGEGTEQDDLDNANTLYSTLEAQWTTLIQQCIVINDIDVHCDTSDNVYDVDKAKKLTTKQLNDASTELSSLSKQLTPIIGPIFSDVVREIKKKLSSTNDTT